MKENTAQDIRKEDEVKKSKGDKGKMERRLVKMEDKGERLQ